MNTTVTGKQFLDALAASLTRLLSGLMERVFGTGVQTPLFGNVSSADLAVGSLAALGRAMYEGRLSAGYHYLAPIEWGQASCTFYGDGGVSDNRFQTGLLGWVAC